MKLGRIFTASLVLILTILFTTSPLVNAISVPQSNIFGRDVHWLDDEEGEYCDNINGGPANLTVGKDFNLGSDPAERRVNLVRALMADFQFSAASASGIVGNFMVESAGTLTIAYTIPPDVNQGETTGAPPKFSGGYGWAQWTGSRQRSFIDFAIDPAKGYMASENERATDAANYAYLKEELATGYDSTVREVKKATTPEDAAVAFEANFEKAGAPVLDKRKTAAREVFDELSGGSGNGAGDTTDSGAVATCGGSSGGATIVGTTAFPLVTTKKGIDNRGIFKNSTTNKAGHPYTAYDILVDTGTEVVAMMPGKVVHIGEDRCPGRLVSIYNKENDMVISYLHLSFSNHVKVGDEVALGGHVGEVGTTANGCTVAHLHIDAAKGDNRPGCSRLNCPASNAAQFIDIGPQLFLGFEALPES